MTFRQHNAGLVDSPEDVGSGRAADAGTMARSVLIVHLRISAWGGSKQDKKANGAVSAAHGSSLKSTRVSKSLIPPEALAPVLSAAGALRTFHHSLTLPWLDDGGRVLAAGAFFKYKEGMAKLTDEYRDKARELADQYPDLRRQAERELGDLFNPKDYPVDIARRYDVDQTFLPFPKADDFRVDGINGAEREIKAKLDSLPRVLESKAREEIASRVTDVAARMVERLRAYTGGKAGSFRDSLVENIRELVGVIPMLNVANDPRVDELVRELSTLGENEPDALREDKALRDSVAAKAEAIVKQMEGFI